MGRICGNGGNGGNGGGGVHYVGGEYTGHQK